MINSKPRLHDAHLRLTAIRFSEFESDDDIKYKFCGECVVMVKDGGVFYIDEVNEWSLSCSKNYREQILILKFTDGNKTNLKLLAAWLKSSLVLYKAIVSKGDSDLFIPSIFFDIFLPVNQDLTVKVIPYVDKIIELEYTFLNSISDIPLIQGEKNEKYIDFVNNHNKLIDQIWLDIDQIFFDYFNLNDNERKIVYDELISRSIYCANNSLVMKTGLNLLVS
jgi:hypothetical protein